MRLALILLLAVLAVALAAFVTRPGEAEFDALLKGAIRDKIATTDVGDQGDAFATIALVGCKLRPSDCFEVVRGAMDVTIEDHLLYSTARVKGFDREASCTGAFTRFFCRKLLDE